MIKTGKFRSINPATGETLEEFDSATDAEADDTIASSHAASDRWREKDISERTKYLAKTAEKLAVNKTELARVVTLEMGKPIKE